MNTDLQIRATIFDLDGVVTDTARLHALAWKRLIDGYLRERATREGDAAATGSLRPFDADRDYRRYVDGKPRYQGLRSFFDSRGIDLPMGRPEDPPGQETVCGLANRKQEIFESVLSEEPIHLVPGAVELLKEARAAGLGTAVASSSRNCRRIVEQAGIDTLFDARVDGETLLELGLPGKPHPAMFLEAARRLGVEPDRAAVFEDAVAGVRAGHDGGFGLVVGVAADDGARIPLRESGADVVIGVEEVPLLSIPFLDAWFARREHRRPSALAEWGELATRMAGREPVVFLDYDGTLTPIVERPEDAVLSPEMRAVVERLSRRLTTVVVSGRGRDDVEALVGLDHLTYAGSHGFDISGPDAPGGTLRHEVAADLEPVVADATHFLEEELRGVAGAQVEPKRFTVAVHYRRVGPADVATVEAAVDRAVQRHAGLAKASGKKVFELRPALAWDKGEAVLWLLAQLDLDDADHVPVYVGDDTTDEDAFRALSERGLGVVVVSEPRPTAAQFSLQDTREVREFLDRLAAG